MAILSHQSEKIGVTTRPPKYVDAFAGPGIYESGEEGSPILALKVALNHAQTFPVPIEFVFIEDDETRHKTLEQQLFPYREAISKSSNVQSVACIKGDCRVELGKILDDADARHEEFGPALVFLDQFGYSGVPMSLISRILSHGECEALTFFFWRELDRFISDPHKHAGVTSAFGSTDWMPAINMEATDRIRFMSNTYMHALKSHARAKFIWPFAMFDDATRLLAWLFFCTNNLRGLEEMKRAMWKVDRTGGFAFSDEHGLGQLTLLRGYADDQLATDMKRGLVGQTLSVAQVKEWVLVETPAYLFKGALAMLEKQHFAEPMNPPPNRRVGQYPDESMVIQFKSAAVPTSLFEV
jgi:three-Cys-motif partner protein